MGGVCSSGEEAGQAAVGLDDASNRAALRQQIAPLQAGAVIPRSATAGRSDAGNVERSTCLVPLDSAVEGAVQRTQRRSTDPAGPEHTEGQQRRRGRQQGPPGQQQSFE